MGIQRSKRTISEARLQATAAALLDASKLCAIATMHGARPYINTAYFAWTPQYHLVWLSDPAATHSRNIRANRSAAVAVFDSKQRWGKSDRGIQLFGEASELSGKAAEQAERAYAARFTRYKRSNLSAYRFYAFHPNRLKLFDEPVLGSGTFVTTRVGPGSKLTWYSTELYSSEG